jgi:hypothetical protein
MPLDRRHFLGAIAGAAALLARPGSAEEARIARLVDQARNFAFVGERIGFISRALVGAPYIGHTLVGGPEAAERFVMREDGFDCVTFCETVLAAARARAPDAFAAELRRIRYRDGEIDWFARNHYFADWTQSNIANGIVRPILLPGASWRRKTLDYMPALGRRRVSLSATPRASLADFGDRLATGDIIGFLSRRPGLDYFHVGFIVIEAEGNVWLRHASLSHGRVLDQPLKEFCAINGVRRVTLLRPQEVWSGEAIA